MNRQFLWLASVVFVSNCAATSIVALWNSDEIVLGADSKRTGSNRVVYGCKIRARGKCAFAAAGLSEDPLTGFSAEKLGESALQLTGGIEVKFDSLRSLIVDGLTTIEGRRPGLMRKEFSDGPVMEYLVACFDEQPTILSADVMLSETGNFTFETDRIPRPNRTQEILVLGDKVAVGDQLRRGLIPRPGSSRVDIIRQAIEVAMAAVPEKVGGRISVLSIQRKQTFWIEPGACSP